MNTKEVIEHHLQSFGNADVEEIVKDYTEASVVYTPMGTKKGIAQIKELFTGFVTEYIPKGSDFELKILEIEDNLAYLVWSASSKKYDFPMGSDTVLVENGKIKTQTVALHIVPK